MRWPAWCCCRPDSASARCSWWSRSRWRLRTRPARWCYGPSPCGVCTRRDNLRPLTNKGESAMQPVNWGIISTALIGTAKVIPAMQKSKHCRIQAIASRDLALAKKWAKELGIPKAYGSYEELLADREIEAVYNPLPNHLHVPWSIRAAEAG